MNERIKAIIEERIQLLQGVILQAGKKLSAATLKSMQEVIDKLTAMMDKEDADEGMMEQAFSPVGTILLQASITGEATFDSYENIRRFLNDELRKSDYCKENKIGYPYIMLTWTDHVVFYTSSYDSDSRWSEVKYRADYTITEGKVVFSNFQKWDLVQVGISLQSSLITEEIPEVIEQAFEDPTTYLMEQASNESPYFMQIQPNSILLQSKTSDGRTVFSGVVTQGNVLNKNKPPIVFPTKNWENEMPKMQNLITQGKALGTFTDFSGHATDAKGKSRQPNVDEYSHKFTELTQDGNMFKFKAEVMATPAGNTLQAYFDSGVALDMSTVAGVKKIKKGTWEGQSAYIVQEEGFSWHRIADVVLQGASPGSAITDITLQSLESAEQEKETTAMSKEEIMALIQAALAEGNNEEVAKLQSLLTTLQSRLDATAGLTEEDRLLLQGLKDSNIAQSRDAKIETVVNTMIVANELPVTFKSSAVTMLQGMATTADEVEAKVPNMKLALKDMMEYHKLLQGKGFYVKEFNDDGTSKNKVESLGQAVDELVASGKERGLIQSTTSMSYPFMVNGEERDFCNMEQNLRFMVRTLVNEHPEYGKAYLQLRNGDTHGLNQTIDIMSAQGMTQLMQAGAGGNVVGDYAAALPYVLPLMMDVYPQLLIGLIGTMQPLSKSTGRIYYWKTEDEDGNDLSLPANFTGSYTNNNVDGAQIKYINSDITEEDIACQTKEVGWQQTIKTMRHLMADFGVDGAAEMIRACAGLIAREWNYNHLQTALDGALAGNVNYGKVIPANNSFDGEQWQKQFTGHVLKARGLIWKKRFADTTYIMGDSDAIDLLIRLNTSVGAYIGNGRGRIAEGVNIVGSLSTGEILVKVGWWDTLPGCQNKLLVCGKGEGWLKTGYVIAPFLGLYVSDTVTDVDHMKKKQGLQSEMADKMVDGNYFATVTVLPEGVGEPL